MTKSLRRPVTDIFNLGFYGEKQVTGYMWSCTQQSAVWWGWFTWVLWSLLSTDVVTHQEVNCGLKERYFCSCQGSEAELSSVWWQLLTSPRQVKSTTHPAPLSLTALSPGVSHPVSLRHCFRESRPSSPAPIALRQCQSLPLPGARCSVNVSIRAVFQLFQLSGPILHCRCCYINRKHSFISTTLTSACYTWALCMDIFFFLSCILFCKMNI